MFSGKCLCDGLITRPEESFYSDWAMGWLLVLITKRRGTSVTSELLVSHEVPCCMARR
jgi:hypothetical protein